MRIALYVPSPTYADWYNFPVLGPCYLKAVLRQAGHECRVFDAKFRRWNRDTLVRCIAEYRPDVVGLSAMTHEICTGAEIACEIKRALPHVRTIVGGCHATALPEQTLAEFPVFETVVAGEGEKVLPRILAEGCTGVVRSADHLTSSDLDVLPYPDLDDYYPRDGRALAGPRGEYAMFTSRGCPFACAFCMQVLGRKVRRRSPESVCDEILWAEKTYGAHTFRFRDEIFVSPQSVPTMDRLIATGLSRRMRWSGQVRINYVEPSLIALAKRSGCYLLGMGVESGDDGVLDHVGRGYSVAQARRAVGIIKGAGIQLGTYYILGHPGETPETARKTVTLASELNTDTIAVGIMVPYPGTHVYDMALKGEGGYRLLSRNWRDYDKYGSRCLELDGISYADMLALQKQAVLRLYLKNHRYADMARYAWQRRHGILAMLHKKRAASP